MNIRQSKLQYTQWNSDFRNASTSRKSVSIISAAIYSDKIYGSGSDKSGTLFRAKIFFWATSESGSSCNFSFKIHAHMTKCPSSIWTPGSGPGSFLILLSGVSCKALGGPLEMCLLIHIQTTKCPWSVWTPGSGSGFGSGSYYTECPAAPGGAYIACLGGSGERRTGVHPCAVTGRLVAGRGVAAHVGGAGGRSHRRTPPRGRRTQVRLYRVPVLLLTVNFAAKTRGKSFLRSLQQEFFF